MRAELQILHPHLLIAADVGDGQGVPPPRGRHRPYVTVDDGVARQVALDQVQCVAAVVPDDVGDPDPDRRPGDGDHGAVDPVRLHPPQARRIEDDQPAGPADGRVDGIRGQLERGAAKPGHPASRPGQPDAIADHRGEAGRALGQRRAVGWRRRLVSGRLMLVDADRLSHGRAGRQRHAGDRQRGGGHRDHGESQAATPGAGRPALRDGVECRPAGPGGGLLAGRRFPERTFELFLKIARHCPPFAAREDPPARRASREWMVPVGRPSRLPISGRRIPQPVAQHDHHSARLGQRHHGLEERAILRRQIPPAAGRLVRGVEAHQPPLPAQQVERPIDDDAVEPGAEQPRFVEPAQGGERPLEGVLGHVVGHLPPAGDHQGSPPRARPVTGEQLAGRFAGAVPRAAHERGVGRTAHHDERTTLGMAQRVPVSG